MEMAVLYGGFFLLVIIGMATLVIVAKIYKMHDVRNSSGEYAWMVPSGYVDLQKQISESQRLIVGSLGELTVHNKQTAELMQNSINALLEMRQELNGIRNEKKV